MPGIQEWIHKLEEGDWARYIKMGALLLGLIALTVAYDLRAYKNFTTQEAMDAAQLARNISEGKGYTTDYIRPLSIYLLQRHSGDSGPVLNESHPDLANAPVYPGLLAGLMKVLPFDFRIQRNVPFWRHQPEVIIAVFNQLLFFASVFVVFRLARRLFDSAVAWVSALILAGTHLFWRFSVSGLSTMLLILLFLGLIYCLVVLEQNQREGQRSHRWFLGMAALAGMLVGIGALTRYSFGWMLLPVVAFLLFFFGQRRIQLSLVAAAAFVVVITPWIVRNYQVSGTPFGTAGYAILHETGGFRGNRLERFLTKDFEAELERVTLEEMARKLVVNVSQIVQNDLPRMGGNWFSAFFLASLFIPFRNVGLSRLRIFVLISLAVLIVVQALGKTNLSLDQPDVNSENLLVLLAPVVFMFGVGMYFILLDQINLPFPQLRAVITAGFGFLACSPLIFALIPPRSHPVAYPPYWPPGIQDIAKWMKEDELMMSDMPWAVAWYGDRQCVWVTLDAPVDPKLMNESDFFAIYDHQKPIKGLYLTRLTTDARFFSQMLKDRDFAWGRFMLESLLRTNVPTGFPLKEGYPGLLYDGQLFLSDYARWRRHVP